MSNICLCLGNTIFLIMGVCTLLVFIWMARGCPDVDYESDHVVIKIKNEGGKNG
jgi:hypothetical protein